MFAAVSQYRCIKPLGFDFGIITVRNNRSLGLVVYGGDVLARINRTKSSVLILPTELSYGVQCRTTKRRTTSLQLWN